ncbi:hypothetical protein OEV98_15400 [Caldibacillus lycopersici]|uniref:Lipoprotein n=1 Tax=Perspicuibacillus lycopersici TaxID=1325689 RepID=A0AAE3IUL8_9BACI|nr:hypothetical protein [Perspicuibacillus lycopersici]MCU9614930.1 hypothetical protein [Perspicuibacillus lycopersici]
MKRKLFILIVFLVMVLIGCSDNEVGKREENKNKTEQSTSTTRPPDLLISVGNLTVPTKLTSNCWMESDCSLQPKNLEELLKNEQEIKAEAGRNFSFIISGGSNYPRDQLVEPDSIEVTRLFNKEETEETVTSKQITIPTETGTYLYRVHAKWTGDIQGEAYYVFKLFVR